MRFIFLSLGYHPDQAGGALRYVRAVAEGLAGRGQNRHEVWVVAPGQGRAPEEVRNGVRLRWIEPVKSWFYDNWRTENRRALAALRSIGADGRGGVVILCHAFFDWAARRLGLPQIFLFTGPWALEYRWQRQRAQRSALQRFGQALIQSGLHRQERQALERSREILTLSQYYMKSLPCWHRGLRTKTSNISGGVDSAQFHPLANRNELRAEAGLTQTDFLWLTVRRLDARMGLEGLLQSFAKVSQDFPYARLWLAGTGPMQDTLSRVIGALKIQDRTRLLGFVPEDRLNALYNMADATVMPSADLEGFGLSTVESLAAGTPVVGSNVGATPEVLGGLESRLIYDAGVAGSLEAKLREVMGGAHWRPGRAACAEYARRGFDWSGPVNAVEKAALAHANS